MEFLTRTKMLLGEEQLRVLSSSSVAIFGLGGVGGGALEALARMGIGTFHLIDADDFHESNLNRQILSTRENLGQRKIDVAENRVRSINPNASAFTYPMFFLPGVEGVDFSKFDFVIDAVDTVAAKKEILLRCHDAHIPVVAAMGCGNRLDPTKLVITDIYKTSGDPLSKIMRKYCREQGIASLTVVASTEEPMTPLFKIEGDGPSRRDVPGSAAFVPTVAGYLLAYECVRALLHF